MKIIVDDKIPYIKGQVEQLGSEVLYLSGSKIGPDDVRDADVLMIRTRTHCNRALLEGSKVKFIVTATIGFDHLDVDYLREAGIEWTNCPGCNATSVGQYVRNTLFLLERERGLCLQDATLGIVGVGHVGSAVLEACRPWVGKVLLNDPPLLASLKGNISSVKKDAEAHVLPASLSAADFSDLSTLQQQCDIITFHTPLVTGGEYPSFHLADEAFFAGLAKSPVIINAARGEVVDNVALEAALDAGQVREAVIDTWEGEPSLSRTLLDKVFIGTPHIAGYSADGKANATRMSLEAVARWMGMADKLDFHVLPPAVPDTCKPMGNVQEDALRLYDPREDSERLKTHPMDFERLRGDYPLRRESFV